MLPEEEEEDRREEIGGLELFGELNDNLVVANFKDENLQEILDYLCTSNTFLLSKHHM